MKLVSSKQFNSDSNASERSDLLKLATEFAFEGWHPGRPRITPHSLSEHEGRNKQNVQTFQLLLNNLLHGY